jgi:hypothetical protein
MVPGERCHLGLVERGVVDAEVVQRAGEERVPTPAVLRSLPMQ